ncbi:MurR/RpiR family transcriptional regulator [Peptacetobacter hominis]|uniref:MurR/RpiR family transcriptional regulator n=1 Tax=Peptacetobacter hominis TaxID=2743610 RepID=A0A544QYP1_9FIRM|nr:MurR/RpiR family transcriptional regulator [Peptacetobacter hominis]TQQ85877.1 MurR/RpiR family transcriptional regulator [Peptacetobacter hominis]
MSILHQLEEPEFKATKSDRILMEYIKSNIEDVFYKSISQISRESGIGEATITRFSKKMGFNGLQDFKVTLAQEISSARNRKIINKSIENDEPVYESMNKILSSNIRTLERTCGSIVPEDVDKASDMLIKANKIYFIGVGYSGIAAIDSSYKFMRIGFNCMGTGSTHDMIMMSSLMNKDDVIVAISHSGETKEIIKAVDMAKRNGAGILSITEKKDSELRELSDVNFGYISGESVLETGSISSKLAQIFIMDVIYTQVVKIKAEKVVEIKIKTTDAIKLYNE